MVKLPKGWEVKKVIDVTSYVNRGISPKYTEYDGFVVINQRCIRGNKILLENSRLTDPEKKKISDEKYIQKYDVLVNSTGVGTLGRVAQVKKIYGKMTVDSHVTIVRPNDSIHPSYFGYTMVFNQPLIEKMGEGATGQTELSRDRIKNDIEIFIAPHNDQPKIATILSNYDNLIENNTKRIQLLEEIAKLIYDEWFVKFRFPGHAKTKFVNSELGEIPEGWEVNDVQNVIDVIGGGTPSTKIKEYWNPEEINWYAPKDLTNNNSPFSLRSGTKISKLGLQKSSAKLFSPFSVMMTSRATVGVVGINITKAAVNQGFIVCIPNEAMQYTYIYFWLKQNVPNLIQLGGGTTFKEVTKTTFRQYQILIPPINVMSQFHELIFSIFQEILNIIRKEDNLIKTRDLLLPKLISGQVDVSNLDIKVPEMQEGVV